MRKIEGSWKKKLEYFWMYYKIPFLTVLAIVIVAAYFIHAKLAEKPYSLQALMYDIHTDVPEEELAQSFAEYAGIDTRKYDVYISTSLLLSDAASGNYALTSLSRFMAMIGTEDLDACMMTAEDFERYATVAFLDLREMFSEEELAGFGKVYTDADGAVRGVYGSCLKKIGEIEGYEGKDGVVGIIYNSTRKDMAAEFIRYLHEGD